MVGALSYISDILPENITKMSTENIYNSNTPTFWENINAIQSEIHASSWKLSLNKTLEKSGIYLIFLPSRTYCLNRRYETAFE